jgi:hypothetical protein
MELLRILVDLSTCEDKAREWTTLARMEHLLVDSDDASTIASLVDISSAILRDLVVLHTEMIGLMERAATLLRA